MSEPLVFALGGMGSVNPKYSPAIMVKRYYMKVSKKIELGN